MKTILYRPVDQTGLGNRLRGLTLCYAISLITGRRLAVDDYLLTEFFHPPAGVDWRPDRSLKRNPPASWRVLTLNLSPENWDAEGYLAYQTNHLNDLLTEDVIEVAQGASFIDALRGNPHYQALWASLGMDSTDHYQWMGRLVERLLARPKLKLVRAARSLCRRVGWDQPEGIGVGVQYRTFYDIGSPHLAALSSFEETLARDFSEVGAETRFFLTTDDPEATTQLKIFLSSRGRVTTSGERKVVHSGYSYEGWSEIVFKIVRKLWPRVKPHRFDLWKLLPEALRLRPQAGVYAEWYLLGQCQALYSTFTTFSEFAAARTANRAKLVRFDPETKKTEVLKESTPEPLVSVITVSFNSLEGLRATHGSLPRDPDFEFLLIDGNSTDGTEEFLKTPGLRYGKVVRESDKGIFDAMNKGILRARGRYVLFMNCGDRFVDSVTWDEVKSLLRKSEAVTLGGLEIDGGGRMVMDDSQLRPRSFLRVSFPHQAAFIPRRLFLVHGSYAERYPLSADQEWFFRTLRLGVPYRTIPTPVACYQGKGVSDRDANVQRIRKERRDFLRQGYGLGYAWVAAYDHSTRFLRSAVRETAWFLRGRR